MFEKIVKKIKLLRNAHKLKRLIKESFAPPRAFLSDDIGTDSFSTDTPSLVPYEYIGRRKTENKIFEENRRQLQHEALEKELEKLRRAEEKRRKYISVDDGGPKEDISYSLKFDLPKGETLLTYLSRKMVREASFVDNLINFSINRGVSYQRIYSVAHIDRRLFSKMISDKNYHPSKDTAIALTLALQLSIRQAEDFLASAGYTLSGSIRRDVAIRFFIENGIFDVDEINRLLFEIVERTLGR